MAKNAIMNVDENGEVGFFYTDTVTISQDRYEDLIKAEAKLAIIKDLSQKDTATYSYNDSTSKAIDAILNIERK